MINQWHEPGNNQIKSSTELSKYLSKFIHGSTLGNEVQEMTVNLKFHKSIC